MKTKYLSLLIASNFCAPVFAQDVVVFGDSLSDVGQENWNLKATYFNQDGRANKLYNEIVAEKLGGELIASSKGGKDYAYSGGVVMGEHSKGTAIQPNLAINKQIQDYLSDHDGKANAKDLYVLWGGGNDAADMLTKALSDPNNAVTYLNQTTQEMASTSATQATTLSKAGAKLIVMPNVPDVGNTPEIFDQFAAQVGNVLKSQIEAKIPAPMGQFYAGVAQKDLDSVFKEVIASQNTAKHSDVSGARVAMINEVVDKFWNKSPAGTATYGQLLASQAGLTKESFAQALQNQYQTLAGTATQMTNLLNQRTSYALQNSGVNVVRLDVSQLFSDMLSDPSSYGFNNTTGRACANSSARAECKQPDGNAENMLFADSFHPSPKAHAIMADYLLSTLQAPKKMAVLGSKALQQNQKALDFARQQSNDNRTNRQPANTVEAIATYEHSNDGGNNVYAGVKAQWNENWQSGVIFSAQNQKPDSDGLRMKVHTKALTGYTRYDRDNGWLGGSLQVSSGDYDTARHIQLGSKQIVQQGSTSGDAHSFGVFGGYELPLNKVRLAALGNLDYTKGSIGGFTEQGGGATQMQFAERDIKSLQSGLGVEASLSLGSVQPYLRTRWVKEWKKPADIRAGLSGTYFNVAAPEQDRSWVNGTLGVSWQPANNVRVFAQASRDFARSQNKQAAVQVGVAARF